jgi:hypothetical protein
VKPGQVGTSNATKPENLGMLDYAHLRVPLPKDLSGSGIFLRGPNRKYPEAYFLMVSRNECRVRYQSFKSERLVHRHKLGYTMLGSPSCALRATGSCKAPRTHVREIQS